MAKTKQLQSLKVEPLDLNSAQITVGLENVHIDGDNEALIIQRSSDGFRLESDVSKTYSDENTITSIVNSNPLAVQHGGDLYEAGDICHLYDKSGADIGRHIVAADTSLAGDFVLYGAATVQCRGFFFMIGGWIPNNGFNADGNGVMSDKIYRSVDGENWTEALADSRVGRVFGTAARKLEDTIYFFGGYDAAGGGQNPHDATGAIYSDALLLIEVTALGAITLSDGPTSSFYEKSGMAATDHKAAISTGRTQIAGGTEYGYIDHTTDAFVASSITLNHSINGPIIVEDDLLNCTNIMLGGSTKRTVIPGGQADQRFAHSEHRTVKILSDTEWTGQTMPNPNTRPYKFYDSNMEEVVPASHPYGDLAPVFNAAETVLGVPCGGYGGGGYHELTAAGTVLVINHNLDRPASKLMVEAFSASDAEQEIPASIVFNTDNQLTLTFMTSEARNVHVSSFATDSNSSQVEHGWETIGTDDAVTSFDVSMYNRGLFPAGHFHYPMQVRDNNTYEIIEPALSTSSPNINMAFAASEDIEYFFNMTRETASNGAVTDRDEIHEVSDQGITSEDVTLFPWAVGSDGGGKKVLAVLPTTADEVTGPCAIIRSFEAAEMNTAGVSSFHITHDTPATPIASMQGDSGIFLFNDNSNKSTFTSFVCGGKHSYFVKYKTLTSGDTWVETDPIQIDGTDTDSVVTVPQTSFFTEKRLDVAPGWKIGKGSNDNPGVEVIYNSIEGDIDALNALDELTFIDYGLDRLMLPGAIRLKAASNTSKFVIDVPAFWGQQFANKDAAFTGFDDEYFKGGIISILRDQGSGNWSVERTRVARHEALALTGGEITLIPDSDIEISSVSTDNFIYLTYPIAEREQYVTAGVSSHRTPEDIEDPSFMKFDGFILSGRTPVIAAGANEIVISGVNLSDYTDSELGGLKIEKNSLGDSSNDIKAVTIDPGGAILGLNRVGIIEADGLSFTSDYVEIYQYRHNPPPLTILQSSEFYFGSELRGMYLPPELRSSSADKFCRLIAMEAKRNKVIASQKFAYDPGVLSRADLITLCSEYGVKGHESLDNAVLRKLARRYYPEVVQYKATQQGVLNLYDILFGESGVSTGGITAVEISANPGNPVKFELVGKSATTSTMSSVLEKGAPFTVTGLGDYNGRYVVGYKDDDGYVYAENVNGASGSLAGGTYSVDMAYVIDAENDQYRTRGTGASVENIPMATQKALGFSVRGMFDVQSPENFGRIDAQATEPSIYARDKRGYFRHEGQNGANRPNQYPPARPGDFLYISTGLGRISRGYEIVWPIQDPVDDSLWSYITSDTRIAEEANYFNYDDSFFFILNPVQNNRFEFFIQTVNSLMPHYLSEKMVRFDG